MFKSLRLYKEINSKKDHVKISQVSWMPNKVLHHYYQNTPQVCYLTLVSTIKADPNIHRTLR